jgi:hypothetical protein
MMVFFHDFVWSDDRATAIAILLLWLLLPASLFAQSDQIFKDSSQKSISESVRFPSPGLLVRALSVFDRVTNLTASVDINSVDHLTSEASPTLTKEGWRFTRNGSTNTFTRIRYLPFAGREIIEGTNYSGGKLLVGKSASLPGTISLPGFEVYNLLAAMRCAALTTESRDGDSTVFTATLSPTETQKAWFSPTAVLPIRIEKRREGQLVMVYTRAAASDSRRILPSHDTCQLYENGRLTATMRRSFFSVQEFFVPQTNFVKSFHEK